MKVDNFDFLFQRMQLRTPVLLLGAGFSFGAKNKKGEEIPAGKRLSEILYQHFFVEGNASNGLGNELLFDIKKSQNNLKEICTFLRILHKENERNAFLTDRFSGCYVDDDSPQHLLVDYPWTYIFSLNIDDLVEYVFKYANLPLSTWDFSHPYENENPKITRLVKLHGSVLDAKSGYIFDDVEYRRYTIESNSLLKEFAHQALETDLVMVGTEFQEDDLLTVLGVYKKSGYIGSQSKRFFITPSISNVALRLEIEQSADDIWIASTTESFLKALKRKVTKPNNNRVALSERGVIFLDTINKQTPSSFGLYKGMDTVYADFFHNADILHPNLVTWLNNIEPHGPRMIISFFGESYVGKTCCSKRLIVELFNKGYEAIQITFLSSQVINLLKEYLSELPVNSKVAIYIEGAAYSYNDIVSIINISFDNISKLIFITEDTTENHNSKRYLMLDQPCFFEYEIKPYMDDICANSIYEKLSQKRRLGHYLDLLPSKSNIFSSKSKRIITERIKQEQDIIDALYFSSEGKSFQDHYSSWLKNKVLQPEKEVIQVLCSLSRLGINRIPTVLFVQMGEYLHLGFTAVNFYSKFKEIITAERGYIALRRSQILIQLLNLPNSNLTFETLYKVASYCVPLNEYSKTEMAFIFEKAIRVKRVRDSRLLTNTELLDLLRKLEPLCKHTSYFWVQYGIAAQITGNYEDANNHLSYAKNMRPNSYQVRHALAKNNIEWGLSLIEHGKEELGNDKFKKGIEDLREIVYNTKFSKSFRYSVHTMVSFYLKYSHITDTDLDCMICNEISNLLGRLLNGPLDTMLIRLIESFISYCEQRSLKDYCIDLYPVYKKQEQRVATEETYDID